MKQFSQPIISWLRSRQFFVAIMLLFLVEAIWIAVSGRYPMAFDEDFHLGIIQLYAHHLSPFFAHQPAGADSYGAVARDPSYLYHYLMSFPWRLITALTHSFTVQVVLMRFINIGFFAAGLVLFRRLLLKTKAPLALINLVMLFFVLTPIVPLVAAQINYDNLLMPLTALSLLLTLRFARRLETRKNVDYVTLITLLIVCLLTSLVKYAFLPIFAAIVCYVAWKLYQSFAADIQGLWRHFLHGYQKVLPARKIILLVLIIASSAMFIDSYGVNVVRYKTPIPECNQVLSIPACMAYGAWNRNYTYELAKVGKTDWNPVNFSVSWVRTLMLNLVFSLNGSQSGFAVGNPLPLPHFIAWTMFFVGLPLVAWYGLKIFKNKTLRLMLLVSVFYLVALWLQNYTDFLHLGQQVAVQGRYLLPILPFIYLMIGLAFAQLFKKRPQLKLAVAGVATACLILGGGALTFILRSDPSWYWLGQSKVTSANHEVQRLLDPVIPGSRNNSS